MGELIKKGSIIIVIFLMLIIISSCSKKESQVGRLSMRTVSIPIYNNQEIELFVEKRKEGFEVWVVGPIKGHRRVLDHHLTHDDLEAYLEYASPGDLVWRDASSSEIPTEKNKNTGKQNSFLDFVRREEDILGYSSKSIDDCESSLNPYRAVTYHLSTICDVTTDRVEDKAVNNLLLGRWTDGIVTLTLEPNHKLEWSCTEPSDDLKVCDQSPDWWNYGEWSLALFNSNEHCGTTVKIVYVDKDELHILNKGYQRLVRVFHKDRTNEEHIENEKDSSKPSGDAPRHKRISSASGETTPILRELEQTVIERNAIMAERLNPGLPESKIRAALSKAKVEGSIDVLIKLYSWSNGTALCKNDSIDETSFLPQDGYRLMDLEEAIVSWSDMNDTVVAMSEIFGKKETRSGLSDIKGQFFPILTDGGGGYIAFDLTPNMGNRVMLIDFEMGKPVQAYNSFEAFIKDVIRANKEDDSLKCFQL